MPVTATWNPEMGIKFGGVGGVQGQEGGNSPAQGQGRSAGGGGAGGGTWDPKRGFKFG